MFIGIDPGLSGAIAFLHRDGKFDGKLEILKTPTIKNPKGKTEYNVGAMVHFLKRSGITGVTLEKVGAMPGQGVTSMFSMGRGLGLWEGIIVALELPYVKVAPQTWQKEILRDFKRQKGEAKQASILNAQRMFPTQSFLPTPRCTKIDDNMCDATNLALYAKKHFN